MAGGDARERASVALTVLNEVGTVDELLASIAAQSVQPADIVVLDGGSTDGTWERLQLWCGRLPLRLLREPGVNIARGRNLAIETAGCEVVAITDAGVRLAPDWLERLLARLEPDVDVVSGFFEPIADTLFERAMGATVLPSLSDVRADTFLPSSRSIAFRKRAWRRVDGYPEWLDFCEDLVFDLALKRAGCGFAFAPDAVARYRPRRTLRAFFWQYYRYARGDGKADLWRLRHAIRYATYLALLMLLPRGPLAWSLLAAGGLAYTWRPLQRLHVTHMPLGDALRAVALVPVIRLVGDVAKMLGYPVGVWWRWTSRS